MVVPRQVLPLGRSLRGILMQLAARGVLLGLVLLYLVVCVALFMFQRSLIYFPQPRSFEHDVAMLTLERPDARVLVSTRTNDGSKALIYFGGNAEDVSVNLPGFSRVFPGAALYCLHYRGYGGSSGKPTEAALFADGLALFDEVHRKHSSVEIIGRSLGSSVAVYVASQRPVRRVVLVTPFDSVAAVAAQQFRFIPVRWLLQDKFESWKYAPQITAPTLIVAAQRDEIVPAANTQRLYQSFHAGIAKLIEVAGAGHNTISEDPDYWALLKGAAIKKGGRSSDRGGR